MSSSYSGTKLYICAPVHHLFNKFLIRAYNMLDSVLQKRRTRENRQISGESKREMRKREDTPREAEKGGTFLKRSEEQYRLHPGQKPGEMKGKTSEDSRSQNSSLCQYFFYRRFSKAIGTLAGR